MADALDILMFEMEESWRQARQAEDQRANITNLIVIIASIIQGALTQTGFHKDALPLTILLIILGIYGALASIKLYERFKMNVNRVGEFERRLNELCPEAQVKKILKTADLDHNTKHPLLSKKIRLRHIWIGLHILIAVLGIAYTIVILIK